MGNALVLSNELREIQQQRVAVLDKFDVTLRRATLLLDQIKLMQAQESKERSSSSEKATRAATMVVHERKEEFDSALGECDALEEQYRFLTAEHTRKWQMLQVTEMVLELVARAQSAAQEDDPNSGTKALECVFQ